MNKNLLLKALDCRNWKYCPTCIELKSSKGHLIIALRGEYKYLIQIIDRSGHICDENIIDHYSQPVLFTKVREVFGKIEDSVNTNKILESLITENS